MKFRAILCLIVLFVGGAATAWAGSDSASVPEEMIPWSGFWWPLKSGSLIRGYAGHPSPLEKYDAYASGYYPATMSAYGLENEYDPDAYAWEGYCDEWSAAAVLYPEPDSAGDLNGILFNVGDKKGLLTLSLKSRVSATFYGTRYSGLEGQDIDDIYPGGLNGFHETLINYIKLQGKPIIMDLDPAEQIWNYPAYRYEMTWYDTSGQRHVTCTVWFADDNVSPDDVGIQPFQMTYSYWLAIDGSGNLLDEPGEWESSHPDFLWYPVSVGDAWLLEDDLVADIVGAGLSQTEDGFEDNDNQAEAAAVEYLKEDRFYPASGFDQDWYRVYLQEGDDFTAFAVSNTSNPLDELAMSLYSPSGEALGTSLYHGVRLDEAPETGWFDIEVTGLEAEERPYYFIEFFSSPVLWLPHLDFNNGWRSDLLVYNDTDMDTDTRLSFVDGTGDLKEIFQFNSPTDTGSAVFLKEEFSEYGDGRGWSKITFVLNEDLPKGVYTYARSNQRVNIPLVSSGKKRFYLPAVRDSGALWTGLAMLNADYTHGATVAMSAFGSDGTLLGTHEEEIPPMMNVTGLVSAIWGQGFSAQTEWIEVESTRDLWSVCLWGDSSESGNASLDGINLLSEDRQDTVLYIPHLEYDGGWDSNIYLLNPIEAGVNIVCDGYDSTGELVATATFSLPAKGVLSGDAETFLPGVGASCEWMKLTSNGLLTGFVRYRKQGQSAAVPFACEKDMADALLLTYIPDLEMEWAGITLLNPNDQKADVWADPYDADGNRLLAEGTHLWYNVPDGILPGSNAVGTIDDIFQGLPPETAFLKIYSDEPLVGFGLHGDYTGAYLDTLYLETTQ